MKFILDTDTISNLIKKNSPKRPDLIKNLKRHSPRNVFISVFTKCELYYGVSRVDNRKKTYKKQLHDAVDSFTTQMNILDFHIDSPEIYGEIRANLVSKGQDIGVIDCMIASQAIAYNYTLVTHNIKHFERIQKISTGKLKLADWLAS